MTVIQTDEWLLDSWDDPLQLCEKLKPYFPKASADDIYHHLMMHGMYDSLADGEKFIKHMQKQQLWNIVQKESQSLIKLWNGPKVPIFIFPSDVYNRKLQRQFNGHAGLAFNDKLFLFVSNSISNNEIKALLTHEYNHICRLTKHRKKEQDYVLLDTIILEGLAECAVLEHLGEEYIAKWTSYYDEDQLENLWQRLIFPTRNIPINHQKHHDLLYGLQFYPSMVGYCVGYYVVKKFLHENNMTTKDALNLPSHTIANLEEEE